MGAAGRRQSCVQRPVTADCAEPESHDCVYKPSCSLLPPVRKTDIAENSCAKLRFIVVFLSHRRREMRGMNIDILKMRAAAQVHLDDHIKSRLRRFNQDDDKKNNRKNCITKVNKQSFNLGQSAR